MRILKSKTRNRYILADENGIGMYISLVAEPSFSFEEDVTHYISNEDRWEEISPEQFDFALGEFCTKFLSYSAAIGRGDFDGTFDSAWSVKESIVKSIKKEKENGKNHSS